MAKKTKNEFDGLTVDELKARRDECQRSIDELVGKRQKLNDKIHIDNVTVIENNFEDALDNLKDIKIE